MTNRAAALAACLLLALPAAARAEADRSDSDPPGAHAHSGRNAFGFRVGGFGFRNTEPGKEGQWDDCKMNGSGVYGQRAITEHVFAEAAFDLYQADLEVHPGMDRVSAVASVAAGARMFPRARFSPYVQVGAGVEWTRLEMGDLRQSGVYPMGFIGLGADVRITGKFHVGFAARTNVFAHFEHHDAPVAQSAGEHAHEMTKEYDAAAQGQISLSYRF